MNLEEIIDVEEIIKERDFYKEQLELSGSLSLLDKWTRRSGDHNVNIFYDDGPVTHDGWVVTLTGKSDQPEIRITEGSLFNEFDQWTGLSAVIKRAVKMAEEWNL